LRPPQQGHKKTDHLRIMAIVEEALLFAEDVLKPGGVFLAKVFQGGTESSLLQHMKKLFKKVVHVKPKASRKESSEMYVLAIGFKGLQTSEKEHE
jgi:23S rRNA (uridine2552-2'-O)-methyltransferase